MTWNKVVRMDLTICGRDEIFVGEADWKGCDSLNPSCCCCLEIEVSLPRVSTVCRKQQGHLMANARKLTKHLKA